MKFKTGNLLFNLVFSKSYIDGYLNSKHPKYQKIKFMFLDALKEKENKVMENKIKNHLLEDIRRKHNTYLKIGN